MKFRGEIKSPAALGRMLRQGRLIHGLTQREIADTIGASQRDIWAAESAKPSIQMNRLFEILAASGVRLYAEIEDGDIGETAGGDIVETAASDG